MAGSLLSLLALLLVGEPAWPPLVDSNAMVLSCLPHLLACSPKLPEASSSRNKECENSDEKTQPVEMQAALVLLACLSGAAGGSCIVSKREQKGRNGASELFVDGRVGSFKRFSRPQMRMRHDGSVPSADQIISMRGQ